LEKSAKEEEGLKSDRADLHGKVEELQKELRDSKEKERELNQSFDELSEVQGKVRNTCMSEEERAQSVI
jgi:chromosome segregation ATPase